MNCFFFLFHSRQLLPLKLINNITFQLSYLFQICIGWLGKLFDFSPGCVSSTRRIEEPSAIIDVSILDWVRLVARHAHCWASLTFARRLRHLHSIGTFEEQSLARHI